MPLWLSQCSLIANEGTVLGVEVRLSHDFYPEGVFYSRELGVYSANMLRSCLSIFYIREWNHILTGNYYS